MLALELRLDKFKKKIFSDAASLNLTHAHTPTPNGEYDSSSPQSKPLALDPPSTYFQPSFRGGRGGRNTRGRGNGGRGGCFSNTQCQVCFKFGHIASSCWHRFNQSFQPPSTQHYPAYPPTNAELFGVSHGFAPSPYGYGYAAPSNTWQRPQLQHRVPPTFSAPVSALLANASTSGSTSWFPNSGASFHVIGDPRNIQQLTPFESPDQIFIGNGQGLHIVNSGSTMFPSPTQSNVNLALHNLLHVPTITKNLISVGQFAKDNGVYFQFHANECVVKSQAMDDVLLRGFVGSDGLYEFPNISLSSAKSQNPSSSINTMYSLNNCFSVQPISQSTQY